MPLLKPSLISPCSSSNVCNGFSNRNLPSSSSMQPISVNCLDYLRGLEAHTGELILVPSSMSISPISNSTQGKLTMVVFYLY